MLGKESDQIVQFIASQGRSETFRHQAAGVFHLLHVGFGDAVSLIRSRVAQLPFVRGFAELVAGELLACLSRNRGGQVTFPNLAIGPEEGFDQELGGSVRRRPV